MEEEKIKQEMVSAITEFVVSMILNRVYCNCGSTMTHDYNFDCLCCKTPIFKF